VEPPLPPMRGGRPERAGDAPKEAALEHGRPRAGAHGGGRAPGGRRRARKGRAEATRPASGERKTSRERKRARGERRAMMYRIKARCQDLWCRALSHVSQVSGYVRLGARTSAP
jgi:hypothetical protein